jgi:hypothetical protein
MIHYTLVCNGGHTFESWFPSSEAYDKQNQAGLIICPHCYSNQIIKGIMAPSVKSGRSEERSSTLSPLSTHKAMGVFYDYIISHSENVGDRFAEEARLMHKGVREQTSIYGSATQEDTLSLKKEGIDIIPLPSSLFKKAH